MIKELDKTTRTHCLRLIFACYFLYLISISIKMVYSAEMIEIISTFSSTKSEVSLGLTFYYGTYALGQVILAPFIKKINMKWFITVTVLLSGLTFALIGITDSLWQLYLIFGSNGFLQAGVWGGIIYFVNKYIPEELSGFASKFLTSGMGVGTALTYGVSAIFVAVANWKLTFVFFAILTVISVFVFNVALNNAQKNLGRTLQGPQGTVNAAEKAESTIVPDGEEAAKSKGKSWSRIVFLCVTAFLLCGIYYALSSWFPNFLGEKYAMPNEYAILFTILLPLSQIPSSVSVVGLCEKTKNVDKIMFVSSAIILSALAVLCFTFSQNMIFVIVISVIILFFARGAIGTLCSYVPLQMKKHIDPGALSLILNAIATLSASAIPPITANIIELEGNGWLYFFVSLTVLAVLTSAMYGYSSIKKRSKNGKRHNLKLGN